MQVEVVAASEPNDEVAVGVFEAEAQGAAAQGDILDLVREITVVAVAFPAVLAAALELLAGVEHQEKLAAVAADALDALGSDEAVQVLKRADALAVVP